MPLQPRLLVLGPWTIAALVLGLAFGPAAAAELPPAAFNTCSEWVSGGLVGIDFSHLLPGGPAVVVEDVHVGGRYVGLDTIAVREGTLGPLLVPGHETGVGQGNDVVPCHQVL